jgi:hypothetical protein
VISDKSRSSKTGNRHDDHVQIKSRCVRPSDLAASWLNSVVEVKAAKRVASKPAFWVFLTADSFFWLLFPNFTMLLPIVTAGVMDRAHVSWLMVFTGCGDILARLIFPPLMDRRLLLPKNGYIMGNLFGMVAAGCE